MDTIECSNPSCYSLNPETNRFCQVCGAPLELVFLWVPGESLVGAQFERSYQERYSLRSPNLLLDGQPGRHPLSLDAIPIEAQPYLRLFPLRLHLPQIYAVIPVNGQPRLVLTQVPLLPEEYGTSPPSLKAVQPLGKAWGEASGFRQLSWLWQMARLWPMLSYQQVASSLLQPQVLRVEGPVFRLRELVPDTGEVTLVQLGELWQRLIPTTQPVVRGRMERLCEGMIQQQITSADDLLQQIDQGLDEFRQTWNGHVTVVALTDPGPTRRRNEDACYPTPHQGVRPASANGLPFAIVCDGIGGHEGGDMAANLAIETVSQQLNPRVLAKVATKIVTEELATIICNANDRITQVNNQQQRQERQRMGTTLTMMLVRDYEAFLANVGDSRIYWITRYGCYQVTTDDDVASREVRLGYNLYPQALRQPAAGALVQALGINASSVLHPTVQRFPLDEDSVFLLCSDGLSDNNLVDRYWQLEVLPVLTGEVDVATACKRLIDLANQKNGHDNVTVVLVHYQVAPAKTVIANGRPESLPLPPDPPTKGRRGNEPVTQGRRGQGTTLEPVTQGRRGQGTTPEPVTQGRRGQGTTPEPVTQGRRGQGTTPEPVTQGRPKPIPPPAPARSKTVPLPLLLVGLAGGLIMLAGGGWLWWQETAQRDNPLYVKTQLALPRFQATKTLKDFNGSVNAVAINPQGNQLAIGSSNGSISLWSLPAGQLERFLRRTETPVMGATFLRNGQQLATFDRSNLELWSVSDGRRLEPLVAPRGVITAMATNPSGRFLAVGDANGALYLWDLAQETRTARFTQELPDLGKIDALAVSPDGSLVAAGSQDKQVVEVWDIPNRTRKYSLTRNDFRHGIWSLAFRPDGQVLASGGGDGKISLWNMSNGAWLKTLRAPSIVYSLGFSADNAILISGTGTTAPRSSVITLWNPANGNELQVLQGHEEAVKTLAIAPNGRLIVSGGLDNQAIIWQAQE